MREGGRWLARVDEAPGTPVRRVVAAKWARLTGGADAGEEARAELGLIVVRQSESPRIRPGARIKVIPLGLARRTESGHEEHPKTRSRDGRRSSASISTSPDFVGVHLHIAGIPNVAPEFQSWRVEEAAHRKTFKDRLAAGSTTMKLASALVAISLAIAGTQAAPAGGAPLNCRKHFHSNTVVGRPNALGNGEYKAHRFLEFSEEHGGRMVKTSNRNVDKLAFYQCDAVPDYDSPRVGKRSAGQVRSAKDPSQCLTISGIDNRSMEEGYERKNGYLTLRQCAKTSKDELMEQQWFDSFGDLIRFRGKNSDAERQTVQWKEDLVYLSPGSADDVLDANLYLEYLDD